MPPAARPGTGQERQEFDHPLRRRRDRKEPARQRDDLDVAGASRLPVHEGIEDRQRLLEGSLSMHPRPIVEHDADGCSPLRPELVHHEQSVARLHRPGKEMQAVTGRIGPQPAELSPGRRRAVPRAIRRGKERGGRVARRGSEGVDGARTGCTTSVTAGATATRRPQRPNGSCTHKANGPMVKIPRCRVGRVRTVEAPRAPRAAPIG